MPMLNRVMIGSSPPTSSGLRRQTSVQLVGETGVPISTTQLLLCTDCRVANRHHIDRTLDRTRHLMRVVGRKSVVNAA